MDYLMQLSYAKAVNGVCTWGISRIDYNISSVQVRMDFVY